MKNLVLTPNGQIPPKIIANFGGEFSLWNKIKMNGIGSPKMILQANETQFDDLQLAENLLIYANLELLKQGFVLRVWQNRAFRAIVFGQDEIQKMEFQFYRIQTQKPNIFAGDLIFTLNQTEICLFIPPNLFKKTKSFFNKNHFNTLIINELEPKQPEDLIINDANILRFLGKS